MTDKDKLPTDLAADLTGLPWPRTWRGLYIFVICSFILWLVLLTSLTELSS